MIANLLSTSDAEIERLLGHPEEITRFLYSDHADKRERVTLGRFWHAIHFVLNGSRLGGEEPLSFLVSEGTPVGDVDVGFGPARVITSQQACAIAAALEPIDDDEFRRGLDFAELAKANIYPGSWQCDDVSAQAIVGRYCEMRDMLACLARQGRGVILYVN